MAKNPNESDNTSIPNQVGDLGLSAVAQIGAQNRISAEDAADRRRMQGVNTRIDAYESLTSVQQQYPTLKKSYMRDIATHDRLTPKIRTRAEAAEKRLTAQAVNELGREYSESHINGLIGTIANSPEAQHRAMGMVDRPYNELVGQDRKLRSRLNAIRRGSTSIRVGSHK